MNTSKLCCHWCKIPLGNATQVTYLNGNLPICDLCLSASAFADKDKRIVPGPGELEALKKEYTPKQKQYIDSVEGRAHMSAVNIIGELEKYRMFFECCSCLFAEGVEFMNKSEIYDSIKREVKKLESCG